MLTTSRSPHPPCAYALVCSYTLYRFVHHAVHDAATRLMGVFVSFYAVAMKRDITIIIMTDILSTPHRSLRGVSPPLFTLTLTHTLSYSL